MQLEDFNNIDFKNAGNLPTPMKAVLLAALAVILLVLGYMVLLNPKLKHLSAEKEREVSLREQFMAKKVQANKIHAYEKQMIDIEHTFGTLLKQLPDKSEMDGLLTDINQAGFGQGLSFEAFIPKDEVVKDFYAEKPIQIKVVGRYHELGGFASEVSKLSRIVTLNDLQIQPVPAKDEKSATHNDKLVMEAIAKTYRYLDDAEIAAHREQEKKAGKQP